MFVYEVPTGPCLGKDTVVVKFEDPSSTEFIYDLVIALDLESECHIGSASVSCDNVISIPGASETELNWELCASGECKSTTYSVDAVPEQGTCLALQMTCDTSSTSSNDLSCVALDVVNGGNFLDIVSDLFEDINLNCPLPNQCYPIQLRKDQFLQTLFLLLLYLLIYNS